MVRAEIASVFILCAGSGDRWQDHFGVPKQLIPFGGEPLLHRTLRLLERMDAAQVYCVTRDARIDAGLRTTLRIASTDSLAETIVATAPYWSARTVLLLGDVFYSERALSRIFGTARDLAFFGRPWPSAYVRCGHGELFAASFVGGAASRVRSLADALMTARRQEGIPGNLWNAYQCAAGLSFGSSRRDPRLLVTIDDYTNDIDSPVDYERRGRLYEEIASGRHRGMTSVAHRAAALPRHLFRMARWFVAPHRHHASPCAKTSSGNSALASSVATFDNAID